MKNYKYDFEDLNGKIIGREPGSKFYAVIAVFQTNDFEFSTTDELIINNVIPRFSKEQYEEMIAECKVWIDETYKKEKLYHGKLEFAFISDASGEELNKHALQAIKDELQMIKDSHGEHLYFKEVTSLKDLSEETQKSLPWNTDEQLSVKDWFVVINKKDYEKYLALKEKFDK